jgi:hypothetical protein
MVDEAWLCGRCRSINTRRSDHCYHCHAPREVAEAAPSSLPTIGHATEEPPPAIHPYRSARQRATVASGLIIAASAASLIGWLAQSRAILTAIDVAANTPKDVEPPTVESAFDAILPISHLQIGPTAIWTVLAICALVAWAAWLSRVVDNLPALGVGYGRVSPQIAFMENFLIGRNLYSMPARVREVTRMLHPTGGGDEILAAAWVALFGSVVIGRVLAYLARFAAGSDAEYLRMRIAIGGLTTIIAIVGYLLVVLVISRVEQLAEERATSFGVASAP